MGILDTLMLSCNKATELLEQRDLRPLVTSERLKLWMHKHICDGCKAYHRQSRLIDRYLFQRPEESTVDTSTLEERILKDLR